MIVIFRKALNFIVLSHIQVFRIVFIDLLDVTAQMVDDLVTKYP